MNKEEIRHFKSLLRQGSLRHMNILLDDKFQSELLNIIKDYELLIRENEKQKEVIDKAIEYIDKEIYYCLSSGDNINVYLDNLLDILKGDSNG